MLEEFMTWVNENWIIVLFAIVALALFFNLVARYIFKFLIKRSRNSSNFWDDALLEAISAPVEWAIWVFGLNFAVLFTDNINELGWHSVVSKINTSLVVVLVSWFLLRLVSRMEANLTSDKYLEKPMDLTTGTAIRKLLQASVVITSVLVILQSYGVSVSGVLAFGGIGGLAVGFAAQDLLANFFGAIMIYMDKPFAVGDWVSSPDREIEGTVEDIGWRRTLIRTFDKRALYVPNSAFNKISVENPSRMTNRRIFETVGVRYSDIGAVQNIVTRAKEMLEQHEDIDTDLIIMVNLNKFGASSIDFFIYCYTKTTNWAEYHAVKQDVLFKVESIISEENAEIAFPTQTLHVAPVEILASQINEKSDAKK